MARKAGRPPPVRERTLEPVTANCPGCGRRMRMDYYAHRTVATLGGPVGLRPRRRRSATCSARWGPARQLPRQ